MNNDHISRAMLAMAETLRVQLYDEETGMYAPAKPKMAIKCAMGALSLAQSQEAKANCELQLGKLLHFFTDNFETAKKHLENAYRMYSSLGEYYSSKRLEAAATICELYINARCWNFQRLYNLVKTEISSSKAFGELYYKFLFYYVEANTIDCNYDEAIKTLYGQMKQLEASEKADDIAMRLYLYNSANLVSCQLQNVELAEADLAQIEALYEKLQVVDPENHHIPYIRNFFTLTKLSHLISDGMTRSARLLLRQMQSDCERESKHPPSDKPGIRWLETPAATVIVCLMTQVSSFFQCNYDRTAKYCGIVLKHTEDHCLKVSRGEADYPMVRTITRLRMYALELMALSNVMVCKPLEALHNIDEMVKFGHNSSGDYVMDEFTPFVHNALAALACYLRDYDGAEKHILMAKQQCRQRHALAYLNMNLGLIYLTQLRMSDYPEILNQIQKVEASSYLLENNKRLFLAIDAFASGNTDNCNQYIRDLLDDAKSESMLRLHSIGLLIFATTNPLSDVSVFKPMLDWCPQSRDQMMTHWCKKVVGGMIEENVKRGLAEDVEGAMKEMTKMKEESFAAWKQVDGAAIQKQIEGSPLKNYLKWLSGDPYDYVQSDRL